MVEEENEGREIWKKKDNDQEEVSEKTEEDWMEQFDPCYVKLHNLFSSIGTLKFTLNTTVFPLFFLNCIPKINTHVLL